MASKNIPSVPMSEDAQKYRADWTAEDCVAELRRIAEIDTTRVVTRNYFRNHAKCSESTWNRHFGTFLEFKRQANIVLSRAAHQLERHIAKHASVDKMRLLNTEKRGYEEKYLRPECGRWQTALVASDLHGLHCDPFYLRVLLDVARRVQPEKIILDGDIVDLAEFSKHTQDPREFKVVQEIKWLHKFLGDLNDAAPNAEKHLVEGNHEARMLRNMAEQTPALMVVLADLHGFTVSKLLGLDNYGINYIARADMTAWTERDLQKELRTNFYTGWDKSVLFGHFPEMRNMGIPGANGHHHKHIVWPAYSPTYGSWEWHQLGCGHQREAVYCNGEKWALGFLLAHVDTLTKRTQFEYIDVSHEMAMVGGKIYFRSTEEPVLDLAH